MDFICLLIIPDLNPVDYKMWSVVQQRVYQSRVHNVDELKQRLVHVWHGIDRPSLTMQLMSSMVVFVLVCGRRMDTLNKCCDYY